MKKKCSTSPATRKTQISTTLRVFLTPAGMAVIKKINNKYWQGDGQKGPLIQYWKGYKLVGPHCANLYRAASES